MSCQAWSERMGPPDRPRRPARPATRRWPHRPRSGRPRSHPSPSWRRSTGRAPGPLPRAWTPQSAACPRPPPRRRRARAPRAMAPQHPSGGRRAPAFRPWSWRATPPGMDEAEPRSPAACRPTQAPAPRVASMQPHRRPPARTRMRTIVRRAPLRAARGASSSRVRHLRSPNMAAMRNASLTASR